MNYISGYHRPFPLTEYEISYPHMDDIVSIPVLIVIALAAPALIIFVLSVLLASKDQAEQTKRSKWRAILWRTHVGWLGLAAGLAATLFITSGLKDMVGKPRPDLLDRCNPDTTAVAKYLVGGLGNSLNSEAEPLVSSGICQQTDTRYLDDGFAAFPSGHSSFSCAGLVYLSLWLSARLSVSIPYMDHYQAAFEPPQAMRRRQSAPPLWEMVVVLAPVVTALFVCASRYADFHHAGIDIFAGAVIGTVIGWTSFRMYHMPIRRAQGTSAWAPRPVEHAVIAGVKESTAHGPRNWSSEVQNDEAYAMGRMDPRQTSTVRSRGNNSDEPILPA